MNFLTGGSIGDALLDFGGTAYFDVILPDGFTFTSESGFFLTERQAATVPEPGSLALFGVGLAGLAGARMRRRPRA